MEQRHYSPTTDAPEAVPVQSRATFGYVGSDDYEYYEPPPQAQQFERQRSPVPEYQQYDPSSNTYQSSRVSAQSPHPPSSDIGRSPQLSGRSPPLSDSGFSKSRPLSPSVQYSEIHSPDPERVYHDQADKEAVYHEPPRSKVPSYYATPVPGVIHHQNSGDRPQVWTDQHQQHISEKAQKKPFYKRWLFILLIVGLIIVAAIAIALGVVFGTKKHSNSSNNNSNTGSGTTNVTNGDNPNVDINTSIGGQINNAYYSKSGAWNGSGIAIASANTNADQSIYAFYQDYRGDLQYTLMSPSGQWDLVGPVNSNSHKALNGTPLSTVYHQLGNKLVWHLFYIDENYYLRERITTNQTNGPTAIWTDGPLNDLNLKTWQSNSIGMQACYWGNYYGQWSYNATQASAGIHMWFASGPTTFQQYDWTNGSAKWNFNRQFTDVSGNGGVGCQTWYGMTEYVWFVGNQGNINMYWQDNNRSTTSTTTHPIGQWTPVDVKINNVQKDSGLGYTNYMIYQAQDTTIRGANVTWGAENTTIAAAGTGLDTWTLQSGGKDIHALRGTHLSITAVQTVSKGSSLLAFFQETGNDMQMYTRDGYNTGGLWQAAGQDPVTPNPSSS